jgi:hypothetical protein
MPFPLLPAKGRGYTSLVKKQTLTLLGRNTEVTEVDILEKRDRAAEYTLEDGSIIRFTTVPTKVLRVDGEYNSDGTPVYLVANQGVVTVVSSPPDLMKPESQP